MEVNDERKINKTNNWLLNSNCMYSINNIIKLSPLTSLLCAVLQDFLKNYCY